MMVTFAIAKKEICADQFLQSNIADKVHILCRIHINNSYWPCWNRQQQHQNETKCAREKKLLSKLLIRNFTIEKS